MAYRSLKECVLDLEHHGQLIRVPDEVDPDLEMAEIHRRVFRAGGPAVFYENVKGSPFPAVSNLFGTLERARLLFRHTLEDVRRLIQLKADPAAFLRSPFQFSSVPRTAWTALPKKVNRAAVLEHTTTIQQLPQIRCWPQDSGAFVLLPQVYTEDLEKPGILHSNLGMYRIQMAGNDYARNREVGMHYQIRRDIGIHHTKAKERGESLRVSVFIGGPPAHTFAAVMYLPEGMSEVTFAGALNGRRFQYALQNGFTVSAEADFCITGYVDPAALKPEGPFGDHLGYYSLRHPFPFLKVEQVYHRRDAIWPFTVVGRPPQEDSVFGHLIQEIAGPMIPQELPGIRAVHAVDASGVHPLLLAIGSERYAPYQSERRPMELLTLANALLGYGPCSLAKYLLIVAGEDQPGLDIHDIPAFFRHWLERVDWSRDLHFQTCTTMDTLDYSGTALNEGSKVVIAAAGPKRRELAAELPYGFVLPDCFEKPKFILPGILLVQGVAYKNYEVAQEEYRVFSAVLERSDGLDNIPLIVLVDDSDFAAAHLNHFLWVAFTRSNPSHDVTGVSNFTKAKHWGCRGPLIMDARLKPHHAPPLVEDPAVTKKVERLAVSGKCLHGIF